MTRVLVEQSFGTVTVGLVCSCGGGVGVVATGAAVAPFEGASWTPGAVEPPHAATATAAVSAADMPITRLRIGAGE